MFEQSRCFNWCTQSISNLSITQVRKGKIMGKFRRQKLHELQNVGEGEDEISNLPDCILHHILSFLPTKDAVGTSILSARWKYLWTSVPNIDFDDSLLYSSKLDGWYPRQLTCFMNFVERVLLLRNVSNMIKFRLSCRVCFSPSRVHSWVSTAVRHKVQELDLCLFVEKPFTLPPCVFNNELLTVVKIEMNCVLELPTRISFPKLKILHLALVTFPDDDSTQKLFSSCLVLQDLVILDCEWMNLKSIMVSIPTLRRLTIDDLPYFGSSVDLNGCKIKIDAANLTFLKYSGYLLNEIFLYNLSSLVDASIYIPILCERRKEIAYRAIKLLRGVQSVKSLRISNGAIESLFHADNVLGSLPMCQNLTHLVLSMEIENRTVATLMDLLQWLPNLESLVFAEGLDPRVRLGEDNWVLKPMPKCFLSCLKSVSLQNFHGNDTEICLVIFLLKNLLVLEKMSIVWSRNPSGDLEKRKEVSKLLQKFPRSSASCVILLF